MEYEQNPDHTWPQINGRVRISVYAQPSGEGEVVDQTPWTANVRLDADGVVRMYGKSVLTPLS